VELTGAEDACGMHATRQPDTVPRVSQVDGEQVVSVGKYAYRWRGQPALEVGDRVLLPENWLSRKKDGPGNWEGVVTELGSTYGGKIAYIVSRVTQPENA
jgi:hypothetical protein